MKFARNLFHNSTDHLCMVIPFVTASESRKNYIFFNTSYSLNWFSAKLNMGMAKIGFATKGAYFPTNRM